MFTAKGNHSIGIVMLAFVPGGIEMMPVKVRVPAAAHRTPKPYFFPKPWDQSRVRLSQLLDVTEMAQTVNHYARVQVIRFDWQGRSNGDLSDHDEQQIGRVRTQGSRIVEMLGPYINRTDSHSRLCQDMLGGGAEEVRPT
jgi:hypothetical protein